MNYLRISDYLWYTGHVLTGFSIIFTHINYNVAVSFVFIGQFITIISRPIGRIKNNDTLHIKEPNIVEEIKIIL